MPGTTPANSPFPQIPTSSKDFTGWRRFAVGLRSWASQFVVDLDPPGPVPSFTATANNLAVILRWEPAPKASGYRIHRGTTGSFQDAQFLHQVSASKTKVAQYTWQDSEDQRTATRFYWVVPVNERGVEGPVSPMAEVDNFSVSATGTAAGVEASASGVDAVGFGTRANAQGESSIAIGELTNVTATAGIGIGTSSIIHGQNGIGVGSESLASADYGIALGAAAQVTHFASVSVGATAISTQENEITFGRSNGFFFLAHCVRFVGENGESVANHAATELLTIAAAASTDTALTLPAFAQVRAVMVRVVTAIPTAATFTVTGATSGTVFHTSAVSTAAGSSNKGTAAGCYYNAAAQSVRITPNAVPAAATGQVRITVIYDDVTAPTS